VDFSRKKSTEQLGEDFDEGSFKSLSLSSTNAATSKAVSMVPFDQAATNIEIGISANKSIGSLGSVGSASLGAGKKSELNLVPVQPPVKHFGDALKELKSADAAVDDEIRNQHLSDIQLRRKQAKMVEIAEIYEQKTGIAVGTFLGEAGEIHQFTKELEGTNSVEHRSSLRRKTNGNQKKIGSEKIFKVVSTHDMGIEQLLKASVSPEERKEREINANADLYRPPKVKAAIAAATATANAMNANMVSTRSSRINTFRSSASAAQSPQRGSPSQKPSVNVTMSMSLTSAPELNPSLTTATTATATASSSLTKKSDYKGEREEYIRKTCSIFTNFDNLEKSLSKASHGVHRLTQEQREKLEEMRENKKLRERAMLSAKQKKQSGSRIHSIANSRIGSRLAMAEGGTGEDDASGMPMSVDQSHDGAITEETVGMYLSMDDEGASSRDDNLASAAEKS
jgi:hypothetical protein